MGTDILETAPGEAKARLRAVFLRRRAALPETERRLKAASASRFVMELPAYRAARSLLAYRPLGAELDPGGVVAHAVACGKALYYPRIVGTGLEFEAASVLTGGRGFDALAHDDPASPALVLVPGVAFDHHGVRLGRGGGHYDRALVRLPGAVRVGLAFEEQLVAALPREPWDVLMDWVVTERRMLCPGGARADA